jgi:hypothetical protein
MPKDDKGAKPAKRKPPPKFTKPSMGPVIKQILDDLTSPMTPADGAELFAVLVMDKLKQIAPEVIAKFDRSWFDIFVNLAIAVVNRCAEADVKATLEEINRKPEALQARILRRRFARSLPLEAVQQLDDTGRYWLSRAAIAAVQEAVKDDELWAALWGHKTGWFPVIMLAKEPGTDLADPTTGEDGKD